MKWCLFVFLWMMGNLLFSQPVEILWYDQKWPDTIQPMKMERKILDSLNSHYIKQNAWVGDLEVYWYKDGLYLIEKQNGKFARYKITESYHFNQQMHFDDIETVDLNGDGKNEIKFSFHFDFLEIHFESGNSMTDHCSVYVDTSAMQIIFGIQYKFECSYVEVTYKYEDKYGKSGLKEYVEIAREEGEMQVEYVIRNKGAQLEIVCNRLKKTGNLYKDLRIENTGIIRYEWKGDKWISTSQ